MLRSTLTLSLCLILAPALAAQSYPRAGQVADLSTIAHEIAGQVTIVDADTLLVEHFFYDGGGARAFFRLGRDESEASFAAGFLQLTPELAPRRFVDATFTLELPAGTTLDGWNAISAWCVPFGFSMGKGTFMDPPCAPAAMSARNGSGVNPVVLRGLTQPVLGANWSIGLDCAGNAAGSAIVIGASSPLAGVATPFGEILIGGPRVFRAVLPHTSTETFFSLAIPARTALCGLSLAVQGGCTGAPGARLSNALDLVLGG